MGANHFSTRWNVWAKGSREVQAYPPACMRSLDTHNCAVALKACAPNEEQLASCKQMLTLDAFRYRCAPGGTEPEDGEECFIYECMVSSVRPPPAMLPLSSSPAACICNCHETCGI